MLDNKLFQHRMVIGIAFFSFILSCIYWCLSSVLPVHEHTIPREDQMLPESLFGYDLSLFYSIVNVISIIFFLFIFIYTLFLDKLLQTDNFTIRKIIEKTEFFMVLSFAGILIPKFLTNIIWELPYRIQSLIFFFQFCYRVYSDFSVWLSPRN